MKINVSLVLLITAMSLIACSAQARPQRPVNPCARW